MQTVRNPFIVSGYVSADYFCDRKAETAELTGALVNGRGGTVRDVLRELVASIDKFYET